MTHVDGHPVRDVIDWRWLSADDVACIGYVDLDGDAGEVELVRDEGEDWGFAFEGVVFDLSLIHILASRRGSEALVAAGRVRVNGATVTEMGTKVDPAHDVVEVDGAPARLLEEDVVLMLHKPLGYVTTMKDDHAHRIVADLVPLDRYPSLFPLGRLDRDTTGLLLFSTDGELGHALLRPRGHVVKDVYKRQT